MTRRSKSESFGPLSPSQEPSETSPPEQHTPDAVTAPAEPQDPPEPPVTPVEPVEPAQPPPVAPAELRRSSRERREPDRLSAKMKFGGKSYESTSSSSIDSSLRHCRTGGGGIITGHALDTGAVQFNLWRPF